MSKIQDFKMYINGEWVDSSSGKKIETLNPENNEIYDKLRYDQDEKTIVIFPIFTAAAYSEPGFYTYYRGECNEDCLTVKIQNEYPYDFVFSGNGKVVKTITKTLKVTETPVAFHVDTTTIPTAVFVGEEFRFSAQVRNTGSVSATGTEVPLKLHTHRQKGPTVELKPGETKEASFSVKFPADAVANQEYLLKIGSSSKILKVINPIARPDDFEVIGQVSHVSGKDSTKALRFDGKESSLKIKKGVDLKDKLFTICVWFKQENEKDSWDHDMGILSGEHDGFRAGMNKGKDPYWSFRNHRKWRHPKPKKGEWIMHTYQLKGRFLPRQTGGQLQDDGTLSDVQEETTTDMSLMLYHNDRREGGHHINDNTFVQGSIDHIGSFLGKDHFMGDIDDIKVYDRSLRFEEIKQIYDEG